MKIEQLTLKWQQISMGVKKKWPAITDEEIGQLKTGGQSLTSLLTRRYQLSADEAARVVEEFAKECFPAAQSKDR